MTSTTVAFIGIGNMGEAVMAGALRGGRDPRTVHVTARSQERVDQVVEHYGVPGGTSNRDAVAGAGLVVIAVEPDQVGEVLTEIADALSTTSLVISLAGRVSTTTMEEHLPAGIPVVRVAPNTPALVGQGMVALASGTRCTGSRPEQVRAFFELSGQVIVVPEHQMPAVGALSGSGPAHLVYVVDAMIEAGVAMGLRRELVHRLAVQTVVGAGALLQETGEHPVVLRERVSSPGGTTVAALGKLDDRAVRGAIVSAMTGRFRR